MINTLSKIKNKLLCILEKLFYFVRLYKLDLYKWHKITPFHCRSYKIESVKIINSLNPSLYIDIGCGLGDILARVNINSHLKCGFDKDHNLIKAITRLYPSRFIFFDKRKNLDNYIIPMITNSNGPLVISFLNFLHSTPKENLFNYINDFYKIYGPFIFLMDGIIQKSSIYKYSHASYLSSQPGLVYSLENVDNVRSLFLIDLRLSKLVL